MGLPFSGSGGRFSRPFANDLRATVLPPVEIGMPDQPEPSASNRFKPDMPQIPGVSAAPEPRPRPGGGPWLIVGGLVAVLAAVLVGGRLLSKSSRHAEAPPSPPAQIDVPAGA